MESLQAAFPSDVHWTRPDGGYQVWVTLPESVDTRMLLAEAQRAGEEVQFSVPYWGVP